MKTAMRAAIPAGGAEMGQRSPRVMAKQQQAASQPAGAKAIGGAVDSAFPPMAADPGHWRPPSIGIAGQDVSAHQATSTGRTNGIKVPDGHTSRLRRATTTSMRTTHSSTTAPAA